jgi:hypothetical protein
MRDVAAVNIQAIAEILVISQRLPPAFICDR